MAFERFTTDAELIDRLEARNGGTAVALIELVKNSYDADWQLTNWSNKIAPFIKRF